MFVDGQFRAPSSRRPPPQSCATLLNARDAGEAFAAMLDATIATEGVDFALARINGARGDEVLHIAPPDGAAAAHRTDVHRERAAAASGTSYPRVQVHAGRNAQTAHRRAPPQRRQRRLRSSMRPSTSRCAPMRRIDHCRLQNCADTASGFDTLIAHVGERATYRLRTVTLGGLTSRSTILVKLAGRGARCELTAASIANGIQTHDMFAEIEHAAPDTVTRELYRGIATDRGKLGFNGKMVVRETAPGADSEQSLKTLLTGTGAEASVRPQLEIYTDRVRAVHGATTGKLDEQMLFYLLSRGIDRRTRADAAAMGVHRGRRVAHGLRRAARAKSKH